MISSPLNKENRLLVVLVLHLLAELAITGISSGEIRVVIDLITLSHGEPWADLLPFLPKQHILFTTLFHLLAEFMVKGIPLWRDSHGLLDILPSIHYLLPFSLIA